MKTGNMKNAKKTVNLKAPLKTDLFADDLRDFLKKDFRTTIRSRGRRLFSSGAVLKVEDQIDMISAQVRRSSGRSSYSVDFFFDEGVLVGSECDCLYEDACKHEAALVYYLIDLIKQSPRASQLELPEDKGFKKPRIDYNDEGFAILPNSWKGSGSTLIDHFRPDGFRWINPPEVAFELTSPDEITVELTYRSRWQSEADVQKEVVIHKVAGQILAFCSQCKKEEHKLCEHLYFALKTLYEDKIGLDWLTDEFNYEVNFRHFADSRKMSIDKAKQCFNMVLKDNGIFYKAYVGGLLYNPGNGVLKQLIEHGIGQQEQSLKDEYLQKLDVKTAYSNAMVWSPPENYQYLRPLLLTRGKLDKHGVKLASYIKEVEYPEFLKDDQLNLTLKLRGFMMAEESRRRDDEILSFMKDNLKGLQEMIQYFLVSREIYYRFEIKKKDLKPFRFSHDVVRVKIKASLEDDLLTIQSDLLAGQDTLSIENVVYYNNWFIVDNQGNAYLLENTDLSHSLVFFLNQPRFVFFQGDSDHFYRFVENLKQQFTVDVDLPSAEHIDIDQAKRCIYLKEMGSSIIFEPVLKSGNLVFRDFSDQRITIQDDSLKVYSLDKNCWSTFQECMRDMHLAWENVDAAYKFHLHIDDLVKDYWFLDFFEKCKSEDIEVFGREQIKSFKYNPHRARIDSSISSDIDWFEINMDISFGGQKVKTKDWLEAARNRSKFVKLSDGSIGILPDEWLERLQKIQLAGDVGRGTIKIPKTRYNVVDELFDSEDYDEQILEEISSRRKALANYEEKKTQVKLPASVNATLRTYQTGGYRWMKFLQEFGFGGCLADDMGLGKTLQAICILADHKVNTGESSLVVLPRTLLFNWSSEIDKFCPHLTYQIHHGPGRKDQIKELITHDIVISTYDTVVSDIEILREHTWGYIILDESQAIKNPASQRYKAMCLLKGKHKLVMTGTPIENSTFDLFAQMNFCNPGLLGNVTSFKRDFVKPIEKEEDESTGTMLRQMIHPFILRRTKDQVASDLPEKTESILYCEMEKAQRLQYNTLRDQIREEVQSEVDGKGVSNVQFKILEGLLRLRQMCNSPRLVDDSLSGKEAASIKIETLIEQLTGEFQHRNALVFSQFVGMLTLIREELDRAKIPYAYLDGSTRDRQHSVKLFNESDEHRIFLMSLKAGNTGLNLIKADYVFLVDPWWNPAVEAQAIDRTHRIGQDKHIFAYKLICKDTIEEKIVELQKKKKKLSSDLITSDQNVFKSLSKKELLALFE